MKTYNVWTHEGLYPVKVEAMTNKEAVAKGVTETAGATVQGGYFGAEVAGSDGPLFVPAKPAVPLAKPYARVVSKPFRRFGRF